VFKLSEGAERAAAPVWEHKPEAPKPRAVSAHAPAAAHAVSAERRLHVARAPRRAFALQSGSLAEKPDDDQWTEL
jgi:hypothetical protein